ncbi:hypothetical protein TrCOL_g366 [Triparma columacea]|uniref:Uncharacterized protein n=1 Tax=Triparma columacea TaxID=722753 RepID=A0A9W7GI20_9STRA|nr:hypothetical protein TrCOL_g366 [Triparma columacea]
MVEKGDVKKCVNRGCGEGGEGGEGLKVEFREEDGGIKVGLEGSGGGTPVAKGFLKFEPEPEASSVVEPSIRELKIAMEENRVRREREERETRGVGNLGERMLKGWAMLAECCDICMTPKVGKDGVVECVNGCVEVVPTSAADAAKKEEEEEEEVRDFLGADPVAERMGSCLMRGGTMTDKGCGKCGEVIMREATGESWCAKCVVPGGGGGGKKGEEREVVGEEEEEEEEEDMEELLDDEEALNIQRLQDRLGRAAAQPTRGVPPSLSPRAQASDNLGIGECYEALSLRLSKATIRLTECEEDKVEVEARKIEAIAKAMRVIREMKD